MDTYPEPLATRKSGGGKVSMPMASGGYNHKAIIKSVQDLKSSGDGASEVELTITKDLFDADDEEPTQYNPSL
jgi:hypothetical protein